MATLLPPKPIWSVSPSKGIVSFSKLMLFLPVQRAFTIEFTGVGSGARPPQLIVDKNKLIVDKDTLIVNKNTLIVDKTR